MYSRRSLRLVCSLSRHQSRPFSASALRAEEKLRIGYVPEHFATPLHFAHTKFNLSSHATLHPFPAGTGTMIEAFAHNSLDVGIGLTEAWVVGLSKAKDNLQKPYHIVGAYTLSPLTWAISTGPQRADITSIAQLYGKKVGISRRGSGSHIMSSVLAMQHGWPHEAPFELVECGPFAPLREAVKDGRADFFMWEHFTSKKFFDDGTLKRVGEIETPWSAWHIAARGARTDSRVERVLLPALEQGMEHFARNRGEAVGFITENMEYSTEDAEAWYDGVRFAMGASKARPDMAIMDQTVDILRKAGVLGKSPFGSGDLLREDKAT